MRSRVFMVLALVVACVDARAETHQVTQSGNSFVPQQLTIAVGDTVEWIWTSGVHTVTSGESSTAGDVADLFDATFNSSNPLFSFTFNDAGVVPYFCRIHEFGGMNGSITVEAGETLDPDNVYVDGSFSGTEIGTAASPFDTIAEAIAVANSNATIYIAPGTYGETFSGGSVISASLTLTVNGSGTVAIGATPDLPSSGFVSRSR